MTPSPRLLLVFSLLVLLSRPLDGQVAQRPLRLDDFDAWRRITTPLLSRDGAWLAYGYMPQQGDGEVIARHLPSGRELRTNVGATPPPQFPRPTSPDERRPPLPQINLLFTPDSRFLISTTFPSFAAMAAERMSPVKAHATHQRGLVITDLTTGKNETVPNVKSVQVSTQGDWIAYLHDPATDKNLRGKTADKNSPPYGAKLVLRNLTSRKERLFDDVTEYALARDGRTLLFVVSSPSERRNGVYAYTPGGWSSPKALLRGAGRYLKLAWNRTQTRAAFLSDRDGQKTPTPYFRAYLWSRGSDDAVMVAAANTPGMAPGMTVSQNAMPVFSHDGKKLYLGVADYPVVDPKPKRDPEDVVVADLWSWHDGLTQSRQLVMAGVESTRTYRGVLDLASGRYTQIATPDLPGVILSDDGTRALGFAEEPYLRERDHDGTYADIYVIDATTGTRRLALPRLRGRSGDEGMPAVTFSPDGQWAAYYDQLQWHVLDAATGSHRTLTAGLPVAFHNENHDEPEPAAAYGWAGWVSDSQSFIAYGRYDVWQLWVDGRAPRNLTRGWGRAHRIFLRVEDIAPHEADDPARGIDPNQPLILRGESETTRASGFFRQDFAATSDPVRLLWGDKNYRHVGRAVDADVHLLTASRFDEFPDVWVTDHDFAAPARVTDGGAQLAPFKWGRAELVDFTNPAGEPLQALLYKPADFDPHKKYPLIVYTYERLSHIIHRFFQPTANSNISFPFYASNGYLVLLPDIAYTIGHPGQSALDCVNAALDAVIAQGFVDEQHLGIQGASWGGYQAAYIITRTNRFRAAEAGAVVGNMTSAYGGIRWTTGQPRLFQYEQTQSRIGAPPTDAPELYIENSPIFHVKSVQTPLLIQHNDADGAVPWEQALELYFALRRHGKAVWLINYPQEGHGLTRHANEKDFARRMWQYFEHYLHDAPAPDWLTRGIPYLERDVEKTRFNGSP
ncbi:MAG: prolyl oligopeptidase family serine peptidase [Cephaloticoccus sp.]|nr:prolyl oligopeptidase family serine peptidase [Cephaloticoccus sp.]